MRGGRLWQATWLFPVCLVLAAQAAGAFSTGIDGYSGDPATGGFTCNVCHSGGTAPTVTIVGPTTVQLATTHTYSLIISGGQQVGGGLDVSASAGTLGVVDPGTYLSNGEITHNAPRPVDGNLEVVWTFNWTAPAVPGTVTLYGAGNSVSLSHGAQRDLARDTTLNITVMAGAATPGESSGPAYAPLLVTGYDALTGNLSISYGAACETTSNNIYFGPLEDVATYGWSGEDCDIGVSGAYSSFNPGSDSYFFVIVGTKATDEGSYGRDLQPGGSENERPPFAASTCGQVQSLSNTCDP